MCFQEGIAQAKSVLRQCPIGTDRNHSRYWIFEGTTPGLYIEKGRNYGGIYELIVLYLLIQFLRTNNAFYSKNELCRMFGTLAICFTPHCSSLFS